MTAPRAGYYNNPHVQQSGTVQSQQQHQYYQEKVFVPLENVDNGFDLKGRITGPNVSCVLISLVKYKVYLITS